VLKIDELSAPAIRVGDDRQGCSEQQDGNQDCGLEFSASSAEHCHVLLEVGVRLCLSQEYTVAQEMSQAGSANLWKPNSNLRSRSCNTRATTRFAGRRSRRIMLRSSGFAGKGW